MQYQEVRIDLAATHTEPLVQLLCECELSYQECDQTTLDPPPPGRARFQLYLEQDGSATVPELVAAVHELLPTEAAVDIAIRERDEDEWRDAWKRYFTTRRIGRFAIVPSWEAATHTPAAGETTLAMDPGRAFGTGGHATTRLCMRFIDELAGDPRFTGLTGQAILDVGCGCGILSIGALLVWPQVRALGVDIDPEAVEVTMENAARNGVADRMTAALTPVDEVPGPFALVLANITGPTLFELSKSIAAAMAPGATLVLSGLLQTESADIKARFAAVGLTCERHETEDEWAGLLLRKP